MNVSFKRIAITLVAMLSFLTASAQTDITTSTQTGQTQAKSSRVRFMEKPERVWPFEAELFYGLGTGFKYHGVSADGGGTFGLELRGNIKNTGWDVGAFLRYDATGYDFTGHVSPPDSDYGMSYNLDQYQSAFSIGVVTDYNFRQGRRVNPFAGLGIGYSIYSTAGHDFMHPYETEGCTLSFIPRFGVELFSWVRFTGYAFILRKGYNTVGISLGLTIGGWHRKSKQSAQTSD